jgi:hypothetical protein
MEMNMVCLGVKKSMWLELRDESVEQSEWDETEMVL